MESRLSILSTHTALSMLITACFSWHAVILLLVSPGYPITYWYAAGLDTERHSGRNGVHGLQKWPSISVHVHRTPIKWPYSGCIQKFYQLQQCHPEFFIEWSTRSVTQRGSKYKVNRRWRVPALTSCLAHGSFRTIVQTSEPAHEEHLNMQTNHQGTEVLFFFFFLFFLELFKARAEDSVNV